MGLTYDCFRYDQPAEKPVEKEVYDPREPEPVTDQDVVTLLPRKGLRYCFYGLIVGLALLNFNKLVAIWVLACHSWPNLL